MSVCTCVHVSECQLVFDEVRPRIINTHTHTHTHTLLMCVLFCSFTNMISSVCVCVCVCLLLSVLSGLVSVTIAARQLRLFNCHTLPACVCVSPLSAQWSPWLQQLDWQLEGSAAAFTFHHNRYELSFYRLSEDFRCCRDLQLKYETLILSLKAKSENFPGKLSLCAFIHSSRDPKPPAETKGDAILTVCNFSKLFHQIYTVCFFIKACSVTKHRLNTNQQLEKLQFLCWPLGAPTVSQSPFDLHVKTWQQK